MNVPYITFDAYGRVASISNKVYTAQNTTYSSQAVVNGGPTVSLVTIGEKYIWNNVGSGSGQVNKFLIDASGNPAWKDFGIPTEVIIPINPSRYPTASGVIWIET